MQFRAIKPEAAPVQCSQNFANKGEQVDNCHNDDIDNSATAENMNAGTNQQTVISLDRFSDNDYITKAGLTDVFYCSERTIQRMVERFEIPPPSTVAGRKVWRAGKLKAWLAQADERVESEALAEAKRMRIL